MLKDYINQTKEKILLSNKEDKFKKFKNIQEHERKALLRMRIYSSENLKKRLINNSPAVEVTNDLIEEYVRENHNVSGNEFFLKEYIEAYGETSQFEYSDYNNDIHTYLNEYDDILALERLEAKYLKKYTHFLLFAKDEILEGLKTQEKIIADWYDKWIKEVEKDKGKGISDFAVGAERIIYSMLNGKGVGTPNSSPIGSDLFFETLDAFVHIDLKTVEVSNMDDYRGKLTVGNNQNSYNFNPLYTEGKIKQKGYKNANLPFKYSIKNESGKSMGKPCLTYFITILYDKASLDVLNISVFSMPNGALFPIYGREIVGAGKVDYNEASVEKGCYYKTIRYYWKNAMVFYSNNESRYNSIYFNKDLLYKLSVSDPSNFSESIVKELQTYLSPR